MTEEAEDHFDINHQPAEDASGIPETERTAAQDGDIDKQDELENDSSRNRTVDKSLVKEDGTELEQELYVEPSKEPGGDLNADENMEEPNENTDLNPDEVCQQTEDSKINENEYEHQENVGEAVASADLNADKPAEEIQEDKTNEKDDEHQGDAEESVADAHLQPDELTEEMKASKINEDEDENQDPPDDGIIEMPTNLSVMVRSSGVVLEDRDLNEDNEEIVTVERSQSAMKVDDGERVASPPQPQYSTDAAATVRFLLLPSQQVVTQRCLLRQTVAELRHLLAAEMKMEDEKIQVMHDGKVPDETSTLSDLGVVPNGTVQLALQSTDPVNHPLQLVRPQQDYHMPDVITVRIHTDNGQYRDIVVEIERPRTNKPFLGGYRHKKTGVEYHHAAAQTMPKPRPPSTVQQFCRDTQTAQQRHIRQQTTNETSTQMTKIGTYVSNQQDRLLEPQRYTTADEYHNSIIDKVIIIQKYYRRWLATRHVAVVRANEKRRREWEQQEEVNKKKEKEDRIKREFERRMNPKSREDFDLLYHALEKWRQEELARIDANLTGAERKAALCLLLDQETQLIASIGRHKLDADNENRQRFIQEFLEKTASPKKWKGRDGKETQLDTPYTLRARQLRDIYNTINMKHVTQDERLDALLTLKHTVKEHDCKLTQEIIELIDREADLLIRGVKESNLDGLRQRISILFLQYIKTPLFNPEAARYLKVPQDASVLRKNIYYCTSCNQYLPSTEFQLSTNSKSVGKCRQCSKMTNIAITRQDFTQYSFMLKNVCHSEEGFADGSKIAFLMQEKDIRYLVEKIWDSQSILSAWNDLYELVLVRWNRYEEWSPWNCILLTKDEAAAHEKVESLEDAYGTEFLSRVKHKHTMAKSYFFRLPVMAEHMRANVRNASASGVSSAVSSLSGKRIVQSSA